MDLRFFRQRLSDDTEKNGITEVVILYGIPSITKDKTVTRIAM